MEGLGHGATGRELRRMRQMVAAIEPLKPCIWHVAEFITNACNLMASTSPWPMLEVPPHLFSAIQPDGALAAAGRTARKRKTPSEDLCEVDRQCRRL